MLHVAFTQRAVPVSEEVMIEFEVYMLVAKGFFLFQKHVRGLLSAYFTCAEYSFF